MTKLSHPFSLVLVPVLALAACTSDADVPIPTDPTCAPLTQTSTARIAAQLSGGNGIHLPSGGSSSLPDTWVEEEYAVEGTAVAYQGTLPGDGRATLCETTTADYRTRVVTRRPADPASFSGTVVVEWLNVSGGIDAGPDFTYLADELVRRGHAWVGVSAQHIGIEGGPVLVSAPGGEAAGAGVGLRTIDPARYGSLHHPGDAFSYDIYTQVGRLLRGAGLLGPLAPERGLAVGESQSAFLLTTYANGIQPIAGEYDGFLIHSRGGGAAPLGEAGAGIELLDAILGEPVHIRDDLAVPVLVLETETDVLFLLGYQEARQPDGDRFRAWEVAGAAHADLYLLGAAAELFDCPLPINDGPAHFVAKAALRHLAAWVEDGTPPPTADALEVDGADYARDADGIAVGGIRTPLVDVPLDTLSGAPQQSAVACMLFGSTTPLASDRVAELYVSPEAYLDAYAASADATVEAGFVLDDDRDALLDKADPSRVAP
jgi:hypothetical protein